MLDVDGARQRAAGLFAFADGFEASDGDGARRCRMVARDVGELIEAYEAERSARDAFQANYERALAVMQSRLYRQACAQDGNPFL